MVNEAFILMLEMLIEYGLGIGGTVDERALMERLRVMD